MFKHDEILFQKIKAISNKQRFKMLEITETNQLSITDLSSQLKLAYNKCADYTRTLEKLGLIQKTRVGKEVLIKSKARLSNNSIAFL